MIADTFRPSRAWGSHRDYHYTRGKLGSDPLYARGQPLLNLGCGLDLMTHVLRQRSRPQRPGRAGPGCDAMFLRCSSPKMP